MSFDWTVFHKYHTWPLQHSHPSVVYQPIFLCNIEKWSAVMLLIICFWVVTNSKEKTRRYSTACKMRWEFPWKHVMRKNRPALMGITPVGEDESSSGPHDESFLSSTLSGTPSSTLSSLGSGSPSGFSLTKESRDTCKWRNNYNFLFNCNANALRNTAKQKIKQKQIFNRISFKTYKRVPTTQSKSTNQCICHKGIIYRLPWKIMANSFMIGKKLLKLKYPPRARILFMPGRKSNIYVNNIFSPSLLY